MHIGSNDVANSLVKTFTDTVGLWVVSSNGNTLDSPCTKLALETKGMVSIFIRQSVLSVRQLKLAMLTFGGTHQILIRSWLLLSLMSGNVWASPAGAGLKGAL